VAHFGGQAGVEVGHEVVAQCLAARVVPQFLERVRVVVDVVQLAGRDT
jgi:hypothetical protein